MGAKSYGEKAVGKMAALEQRHRDRAKGCFHAGSSEANSTGPRAPRGSGAQRSLALFSVAIDTMLQGPELLNLTVKDVRRPDGTIRSVIEVARARRKPPVEA